MSAGRSTAPDQGARTWTYPRRQFDLYQRIICGEGSAEEGAVEPSSLGAAHDDDLTFAQWQREQGLVEDGAGDNGRRLV